MNCLPWQAEACKNSHDFPSFLSLDALNTHKEWHKESLEIAEKRAKSVGTLEIMENHK